MLSLTPIVALALVLVPMEAALLTMHRKPPLHRYLMIVSSVSAIGLGLVLLVEPGPLFTLAVVGLARQGVLVLVTAFARARSGPRPRTRTA